MGLLVNTLAADDNYPVLNRDNLTIPIQMQLSHKIKIFSRFSADKGDWARLPGVLLKSLLKREFLGIDLTTFSESVISKIKKL